MEAFDFKHHLETRPVVEMVPMRIVFRALVENRMREIEIIQKRVHMFSRAYRDLNWLWNKNFEILEKLK